MKSVVTLYSEQNSKWSRTIKVQCEDGKDDEGELLSVEYEFNYPSGRFQSGYCLAALDEVLNKLNFQDYESLAKYLVSKYAGSLRSWIEIINDFEKLGIQCDVDEEEGDEGVFTNIR